MAQNENNTAGPFAVRLHRGEGTTTLEFFAAVWIVQ